MFTQSISQMNQEEYMNNDDQAESRNKLKKCVFGSYITGGPHTIYLGGATMYT